MGVGEIQRCRRTVVGYAGFDYHHDSRWKTAGPSTTRARRPMPPIASTSCRAWRVNRASVPSTTRCSYNDLSVIFYTPAVLRRRSGRRHLRCLSRGLHGEVPAHLYLRRADQHLLARARRRCDGALVRHLQRVA
ncbi:MAG: hypothetical protein ACLTSX_12880 [Collinsella sp.]